MSSAKPMSSISSASSSTTVRMRRGGACRADVVERPRPGVPTTTSTPRSSDCSWRLDRLAAVDRDDRDRRARGRTCRSPRHLHRQLAGRHEHERGAGVDRAGRPRSSECSGQGEGGRLAGAGCRLADEVAAREQGGIVSPGPASAPRSRARSSVSSSSLRRPRAAKPSASSLVTCSVRAITAPLRRPVRRRSGRRPGECRRRSQRRRHVVAQRLADLGTAGMEAAAIRRVGR